MQHGDDESGHQSRTGLLVTPGVTPVIPVGGLQITMREDGDCHLDKAAKRNEHAQHPAITPEMIEAGLAAFEDWLSEQRYGWEDLGGRDLVARVLKAALDRT